MNSAETKTCKAFLQIASLICFLLVVADVFSANAVDLSVAGVTNLDGRPAEWSDSRQATVLIFLSVDCPISNRYAPTLRKLQSEFQNARWVLVYPNIDEDSRAIQKNLGEYELRFEAWRDTKHSLVKATEVTITPEVAVFLPKHGFVYRGRIDDRNADFGKHRAEAKTNDLREVLLEIASGKIPSPRVAKAVGCYIPKLKD